MAINRILAVRNDRFGEFLLTVPALYQLKQAFPGSKLSLVVAPVVRPLAQRLDFVDEVIVWEKKKHTIPGFLKLVKEYKSRHYDLCVIFNPCKAFNIISFLAGIPLRAGYNRKWGFLLNRKIEDRKADGLKHEVDYNIELLETILHPRGVKWFNLIEIKEEDFSDSRLLELGLTKGEFAVIHPWSSNREKEWPCAKFQEVCRRLALGLKVAVIGGKEEGLRSAEYCRGLDAVDLTGKTSLVELGALLKKSRFLLTNDSGPMHLAAAAGTPVVALFRKSPAGVSARRWGPLGSENIVIENEKIADITVDEVMDGIKKMLAR